MVKQFLKSLNHTFYIFFICMIISCSCLFYFACMHKHDVFKTTSPDGFYTVKFQQVGIPGFLLSHATSVKVTITGIKNKDKSSFNKSFTVDVYNDGKDVESDNCKVIWKQKSVDIILMCTKQPGDSHIIDFDK